MCRLYWFSGITHDTLLRYIGWTYVALALLLIFVGFSLAYIWLTPIRPAKFTSPIRWTNDRRREILARHRNEEELQRITIENNQFGSKDHPIPWVTEFCLMGHHKSCDGSHGHPTYRPCTCCCHAHLGKKSKDNE